jgi:hypothetical protein
MSDASRVQLTYKAEASFSEASPAPEAMTALRIVSEGLKHNNATVVSDELRSDRSRSDLLLLGTDVAGDIAAEFSFASFDDFIAAAMCANGWTTDVVKNGVFLQSFRIQRGNLDIPTYFMYQGCCVNTWSLDISARAIVKTTFGMMGAKTTARATPTQASSVVTIPPSPTVPYTIMTAGPNVAGLDVPANFTGIKATALRMNVNNNLRARPDIQSRDSAQFGMGVQDVTGSLLFYFQNLTLYNLFLANTGQTLTWDLKDPISVTKKYTFLATNVKFTDFEIVTPGVEQDVIATCNWRALYDATAGVLCHLKITRVPT